MDKNTSLCYQDLIKGCSSPEKYQIIATKQYKNILKHFEWMMKYYVTITLIATHKSHNYNFWADNDLV